jgi:hypothetical protein
MKELFRYILSLFGQTSENQTTIHGELLEEPEEETIMSLLRIIRYNHHSAATVGDIIFPCGTVLKSLELPWLDNARGQSCVPVGLYEVKLRQSPVVERTSKGKYKEGYEICNVPNRTFIMFHIGNYPRNSDGCVLTGMKEGTHEGVPAVWSSAAAFDIFMDLMKKHNITHVSIENAVDEAA